MRWYILFVLCLVASNILVTAFGHWMTLINSFFLIGLSMAIRSHIQDITGNYKALKMGALVFFAGWLSYIVNTEDHRVAVASVVAFIVSMTASHIIHSFLQSKDWLTRANYSNIPAALIDTLIFTCLAFGTLSYELVLFQFLCKAGGAAIYSMLLMDRGITKQR